MRHTILLTVILFFSFFGCRSVPHTPGELTKIDMNQAFDQKKSVELSELVKSVEIVRFFPPEDTYFDNARSFAVGKKYIMIADDRGAGNIILCKRNGRFVRNIGRPGKGPGEFLCAWLTIMDPSEQYIIIADYQSNKLIKYSVTGKFLKERKIKVTTNYQIFDDARFINEKEFILLARRPVKGFDGFASMPVYDLDLNPTGKILPRANDKFLPMSNNRYQLIGESPERIFFWEPYFDTLYTINPDHSTEATHIIGWSKNGPTYKYMITPAYDLPPGNHNPVNFIYGITETKKYFFISGISNNTRFSAAYVKNSGEIFLLNDGKECLTTSNQMSVSIKNDLFGIEPVHIRRFSHMAGRYIWWLRLDMIASMYDLDCIRNKEVRFPEIRDTLVALAQSPDAANNLTLLLMEAK